MSWKCWTYHYPIIGIFDDEKGREEINHRPTFLCALRNQSIELTDCLDKKIAEYFPRYYEGVYKLETTKNEKEDYPIFVNEYVERIKNNNTTQGKNGLYYEHGTREIATVQAILSEDEVECSSTTMDMLISIVADTVLISKESISTKLDAIALLLCIAIKYQEDYWRNQGIFEKLFDQRDIIEVDNNSIISSNIDSISLKIGLRFLFVAMGKDVYSEILELMPYIKDEVATTIAVTHLIVEWLEMTDKVVLPVKVESIILQNTLQWMQSEHLDIRWNATRILLTMSRNPENYGIVNRQLVSLIDSGSAYVKNLILRKIHKIDGIMDNTKEYVISKCKNDANYVVRKVCLEIEGINRRVKLMTVRFCIGKMTRKFSEKRWEMELEITYTSK